MPVNIRGFTRFKGQTFVNFPPTPALNLDFTQGYSNGLNPLPSSMTFSRADASAIATHTGPDGLVRRAAHNMVYPSTPASGWDAGGGNVSLAYNTTDTTAPDGTYTAGKITESTATGYHYLRTGLASTTVGNYYTWSAYLKKGTTAIAQISCQGSTSLNIWASFNLNTGNVVNKGSATSAYITNVGNGWYRCSISGLAEASNINESVFFVGVNNDPTLGRFPQYAGNASNYYYVWGAQLEQNITPSYLVTTTSAAVYSTPRFNYDPITLQPKGLLIEENRTNIITNSSFLSSGGFTVYATTRSNTVVGPDGVAGSGQTIKANAQTGTFLVYTSSYPTIVSGSNYTLSTYVKPETSKYVYLNFYSTTNKFVTAVFDLSNTSGSNATQTAVGSSSGTLVATSQQYVGNNWFRLSITASLIATVLAPEIGISPAANGNIFNSTGEVSFTSTGTETISLYGAQLEAGTFPTSYIPTTSTAVTRAAESLSMSTSSWLTQGIGTLYSVSSMTTSTNNASNTAQRIWQIDDGSDNNAICAFYSRTDSTITPSINTGNTTNQIDNIVAPASPAADVDARTVMVWNTNDTAISLNGSNTLVDNTSITPYSSMTTLRIGNRFAGDRFLNGHIKSLQYWPRRFTDTKLQVISKG